MASVSCILLENSVYLEIVKICSYILFQKLHCFAIYS